MKTTIILAIMALSLSIFGLMSCDEDSQNSIPTVTSEKNDLSKPVEVKAISNLAQGLGHVVFHNEEGDISTLPYGGGSGGCKASGWFCGCQQISCPAGQVARCVVTLFSCDCSCTRPGMGMAISIEEAVRALEMRSISEEELESVAFYSNYLQENGYEDLNNYMYKSIEAANSNNESDYYTYTIKYLEQFESLPEDEQGEINLWLYYNNPNF